MPDNVIDNLQIQIAASSTQAEDKVTALVGSLTTLKGVLNNFKSGDVPKIPRSLANNISALTGSVSKITDDHARKLIRLSSALKSISGIGEIKISSKLGENIFDLTAALDEMKPEHTENLKRLGEALGSLSGEDNVAKTFQSIARTETKIGNITDYLYNVSRLDFSNLTDAAVATNAIAGAAAAARSASPVRAAASAAPVPVLDSGTTTTEAEAATGALREEAHEAREATHEIEEHGKAHERAAEKVQRHNNVLKKLVSSFGRILLYRTLRSIIKEIGQAFAEGRDNLVRYSAAMNSLDAARVNANMSTFATSMLYVKNSVAAAAGPLIQTLVPIIQTVANWFVRATNTVNQFFAALRGNTSWTRAKEYALDYAEGLDKAKGAAKELQKYLLPFDELNVLPSQNTGGAGGADALDYSKMFEEVETFDENVSKIAEKVREVIDFVKTNFDDILAIATTIGAVILGWKVNNSVSNILDKLNMPSGISKTLQVGVGIALAITGVTWSYESGFNLGENGWGNLNLLEKLKTVLSPLIAAAGGAMIGGAVAGVPGAVIGATFGFGIALTMEGIGFVEGAGAENVTSKLEEVRGKVDTFFDETKNKNSKFWDELGKDAEQKAPFLLVPIKALKAATNNTLDDVEYRFDLYNIRLQGAVNIVDDIVHGDWKKAWEDAKETAKRELELAAERLDKFQQTAKEAFESIKNKVSEKLESIKQTTDKKLNDIKDFWYKRLPQIAGAVDDWFGKIPGKIGYWMGLAFGKLMTWNDEAHKWALEAPGKIIDALIEHFVAMPSKIKEQFDNVDTKIREWRDNAITWIAENVPAVAKALVDVFANIHKSFEDIGKNAIIGLWNGMISLGTWLHDQVKDFLGGLWSGTKEFFGGFASGVKASYVPVKPYAYGGFPDTGEMFIARERGPELVGRVGNRNAVANNNQIVEGISEGVEEANEGVIDAVLTIGVNIVNAIQNNKNGVSIDDIARGVTRWQNRQARALGV